MWPPRRDECPGASHWPVGCDSGTGQGAFEYAGTMRDGVLAGCAVGVLAGAVDSTREGCGLLAWLLHTYNLHDNHFFDYAS